MSPQTDGEARHRAGQAAREKNQAALEARHQEIEEAIGRPAPGTLTGHAGAATPPQLLRAAAQLVEERLQ